MIQKWWFCFERQRMVNQKKFEDVELQALMENSAWRISWSINVDKSTVIFDPLHAMRKIEKKKINGFTWIVWIDYSKLFNHLHFIAFSSQKKKQFLNQIVTDDEKWIYYNPKRKKS